MSHGRNKQSGECCSICLKFESSVPQIKVTRGTKKDSWILCDCCKRWYHSSCGGITSSQYSKICRDSLWIKCVVCCVQQILMSVTDEDTSSTTTSIIEAAKRRILEANAGKGSKRRQSKVGKQHTSTSKLKSGNDQFLSVDGVEVSSVVTAAVDSSADNQGLSVTPFSSGRVRADIVQHKSESAHGGYFCDIETANAGRDSICNHRHLQIDDTQYSSAGSVKNIVDNRLDIDVEHGGRVNINEFANASEVNCYKQEAVVIAKECDVDNILIIDNIDGASDFATSRRILQEIHLYCPSVKIDFAYSLAKGGVAIHTTCQEDRDLLLAELPSESFGCGVKHLPKGHCDKTVFVKGVDTSVSVSQLTGHLLKFGITVIDIRRLSRRHTGKPTHIVKIKCSENSAKQLLNTRLVINNKVCLVEKERSVRVVRCFNCQSLGHLARHCKNSRRCEVCSETHAVHEKCTSEVKCCNCFGKHPASSSVCPVYLERHENLAKQHSIY